MELLTKNLNLQPNFNGKPFSSIKPNLKKPKSKKSTAEKSVLINKRYLKTLKKSVKSKIHTLIQKNNLDNSPPKNGPVINKIIDKRQSDISTSDGNIELEEENKKKHQVNGSFVESNSPRKNVINANRTNEVYGSKSFRSCQRKEVKPILAERSNRAVTLSVSTYGKMCSQAKEKFNKKFGDKTPDSSKLTMLDLIFYNPSSNPMPEKGKMKAEESDDSEVVDDKKDENKSSSDSNTPNSTNDSLDKNCEQDVPVPQLRISADGKVIVSQDSLVVEQSLGEISSNVEYHTDNKSKKRSRIGSSRQGWTHEETLKFYKALHSIGSDFELMKTLFPGRSRGNLKRKFKREERVHGVLLDKVMFHHAEFNPDEIVQELDDEHKLEVAKATCGRNLQVKKRINDDDHTTISPKKRRPGVSDLLSAKELKAILSSDEKPIAIEEKCNSNLNNQNSMKRPKRKKIKKKSLKEEKPPKRHFSDIIKLHQKQEFERENNNPSPKKICQVSQNHNDDRNDHIVISTNIEYENVKYTRYITYDSNNLENPVEINETISHE